MSNVCVSSRANATERSIHFLVGSDLLKVRDDQVCDLPILHGSDLFLARRHIVFPCLLELSPDDPLVQFCGPWFSMLQARKNRRDAHDPILLAGRLKELTGLKKSDVNERAMNGLQRPQ